MLGSFGYRACGGARRLATTSVREPGGRLVSKSVGPARSGMVGLYSCSESLASRPEGLLTSPRRQPLLKGGDPHLDIRDALVERRVGSPEPRLLAVQAAHLGHEPL